MIDSKLQVFHPLQAFTTFSIALYLPSYKYCTYVLVCADILLIVKLMVLSRYINWILSSTFSIHYSWLRCLRNFDVLKVIYMRGSLFCLQLKP